MNKTNKLNKNEQLLFDSCITAGSIQALVGAMLKNAKGRKEVARVAQALKLDGIAHDIKPSDNRPLAVLKTQVSRASDTHSLQGLGANQDAEVKAKQPKPETKPMDSVDTGEGIEPTGKGKAKTMTKEDVWDFVATYFTKDELDALVLDWATRHTNAKKVA